VERERPPSKQDGACWITPATIEDAARALADLWSRGEPTAVIDGRHAHLASPGVTLISTERLDRIRQVDRENGAMVVEAGASIDDVRSAARSVGLWCPALRWLPGRTSIGAAVAGGHGRRGRRYGSVRDYLLGMRFVCPSAGLVRHGGMTIKNATGYNLTAAVAGSRGTLGIVVEIILRLVPLPAARSMRPVRFPTREQAFAATRMLADPSLGVDALELATDLIDDAALLLIEVEDAAPSVAERRLDALLERALALGGAAAGETAWPPLSVEWYSSMAARIAVEPRRLAETGARILAAAHHRGLAGILLAEATGGALELIVPVQVHAVLEEIMRSVAVVDHSSQATRLYAALKAAFDPADLLHSL
jgi:FAD/FMN-containing dehydrogenase